MGSLSGMIQRPVIAATAIAVASVSSDIGDKLPFRKSLDTSSTLEESSSPSPHLFQESKSSWASIISVSKPANFSSSTRVQVPIPDVSFPIPISQGRYLSNSVPNSVLLSSYQSAELRKFANPISDAQPSNSSPEVLYRWHLPNPKATDILQSSDCSLQKSRTVVVLLGWLGSKQKHLKRYAEWYTSRGFHVITFTFSMADLMSYQVGGKAEKHVESLVNHLKDWLEEECGKNLVFHTFSNTGWLTYGAILDNFEKQDPSLKGRIKGCIVDSAPVATPDPQVFASGFSAAFLKKQSVATKGAIIANESGMGLSLGSQEVTEAKPAVTEAALLLVLEKFFDLVLNLPTINRRLSDVMGLLQSGQPSCPQLYMYSSADCVIPANSVESFIEEQRRNGHEVRACNFVSTPHVDHLRNNPKLYTSQLTKFLEDSVLASCKHSS